MNSKIISRTIALMAISAISFSCTKEIQYINGIQEEEAAAVFKLNVAIPESRTVFDGENYSVEWEASDELGVVISDGETSDLYRFTKCDDGDNAFETTGFVPSPDKSYTYYVIYPYNEGFSVNGGKSSAVINIASGIQSAAGSSSHIKTPLYGKSETEGSEVPTVSLSHLAAIIKVKVTNNTGAAMNVSSLSVSAADSDLALSGMFSLDFETGVLVPETVEASASVSADCSIAEGDSYFFIACAPFKTSSDITVSVNAGNTYDVVKTGNTYDFAPGTVYTTTVICEAASEGVVLQGTAIPGESQPVAVTLENENVYAWRGELQAGSFSISADGGYVSPESKTFGEISSYTVVSSADSWEIPTGGIYRIVIDKVSNTVVVYSPETDLKNTEVSYNNTVDGINPYKQEVTELWMWGGFNSFATESGMKTGFDSRYKLLQSLADPNVFVYHGDVLPRLSAKDANNNNEYKTGFIKFLVSNIENNVYAYGSTADAKRNDHSGYYDVTLGEPAEIVSGQSDNRYAYFIIPENVNYVEVNIEKLTVVFDNR